MGYPGTSLEKAWRNSKDEVAQFLDLYHGDNYLVLNVVRIITCSHFLQCSLLLFSQNVFMNLCHWKGYYNIYPLCLLYLSDKQVEYFGWPDHHPPSLPLLLACVQRIDQWLNADPQNVVAVHCMVLLILLLILLTFNLGWPRENGDSYCCLSVVH